MVEHVRAFGQRIPLPYAAELEEHFGIGHMTVQIDAEAGPPCARSQAGCI